MLYIFTEVLEIKSDARKVTIKEKMNFRISARLHFILKLYVFVQIILTNLTNLWVVTSRGRRAYYNIIHWRVTTAPDVEE